MKTVPRRRSPHQAMTASDSYLRVMTAFEVITLVKNQGQCGSCWAFMTDALEGVLVVRNGWTQTMSEQQILDCNTCRGAKVERRDSSACSAVAT